MDIKEYLELVELAKNDIYTHKQRRDRALEYKDILYTLRGKFIDSIISYKSWLPDRYRAFSRSAIGYLKQISAILVLLSFILGAITGVALLSYSGREPVNVIYFIFVAMLLPMLSSLMVILSFFLPPLRDEFFIKFTPAFWLEKLVSNFVDKHNQNYQIDKSVYNYLLIKRGVGLSIIFYIGMLISLLVVVSTQDIAFAWSTTLDITAKEFHNIISYISMPWSSIISDGVVGEHLIDSSRLFRLGEGVSKDMIQHASILGHWWKFLAFGLLFYAIFLRLLLYILVSFKLKKEMVLSLKSNQKLKEIFSDIHTPIVITKQEIPQVDSLKIEPKEEKIDSKEIESFTYDSVVGWDIDKMLIERILKSYDISTREIYELGGVHSISDDMEVIDTLKGSVALAVKSWEPPVGDLWDIVEDMLSVVDDLSIILIGIELQKPKDSDIAIWSRELSKQRFDSVRLRYE
jgi:hypothetical protein